MQDIRASSESIRQYILENVEQHAADISRLTARKFGITRQAVNRHVQRLVAEKALIEAGRTRSRTYRLAPMLNWQKNYVLAAGVSEDVVWRNDVAAQIGSLPANVLDIWQYVFTEMFNNVIDHSEADIAIIRVQKTVVHTELSIFDTGIGIFRKIQAALNLLDESHAVLELSKGKLTTDPKHHSGEGIFFTSRMFDEFSIDSGSVHFSHYFGKDDDWIRERPPGTGTLVWLRLNNHTARTAKEIFDQFTTEGDSGYGFTRTVVPVRLAQYGDDKLISRSQAKRLLARVELFKVVIFDFESVESVGQAFADEIFRVFAAEHPDIALHVSHTSKEVDQMISRARTAGGWPPLLPEEVGNPGSS